MGESLLLTPTDLQPTKLSGNRLDCSAAAALGCGTLWSDQSTVCDILTFFSVASLRRPSKTRSSDNDSVTRPGIQHINLDTTYYLASSNSLETYAIASD